MMRVIKTLLASGVAASTGGVQAQVVLEKLIDGEFVFVSRIDPGFPSILIDLGLPNGTLYMQPGSSGEVTDFDGTGRRGWGIELADDFGPPGSPPPPPGAGSGTYRLYSEDPANESLLVVRFPDDDQLNVNLIIGPPPSVYNPNVDPPSIAFDQWGTELPITGVVRDALIPRSATVNVIAHVESDIHNVIAANVARLKSASGTIVGDVINEGPADVVRIEADGLTGSIRADDGNIGSVLINGDALDAEILADAGAVESLDVSGDFIGTVRSDGGGSGDTVISVTGDMGGELLSSNLVEEMLIGGNLGVAVSGSGTVPEPFKMTIEADSSLRTLDVGGYVFVDEFHIEGDLNNMIVGGNVLRPTGSSAPVGQIKVDGLADGFSISGNATVDINFGSVGGAAGTLLSVVGDYTGAMELLDGLPTAATISIGDSLTAGSTISLNNTTSDTNDVGLAGQIIINASNMTSGSFAGTVEVLGDTAMDDVIISADAAYDELPDDLGGGAIGVAPYNFHGTACTPANEGGVTLTSGQFDSYVATLVHYGPVFEGTGSTEAIKIEFGIEDPSQNIFEDITDHFDITVAQIEGSASRDITITPAAGFEWEEGLYRVTPTDLLSAGVSSTPAVVYDFTSGMDVNLDDSWSFMLTASKSCTCPNGADVNNNGVLEESSDFFAWVNAFGNGDTSADQNCDGSVTGSDFFAWIVNFNNDCF